MQHELITNLTSQVDYIEVNHVCTIVVFEIMLR